MVEAADKRAHCAARGGRLPCVSAMSKQPDKSHAPEILNRRARHDYEIGETLEVGVKLIGTEVKSVRAGKVSLAEGWVECREQPPELTLHGVHIDEYAPAGTGSQQHDPTRSRRLLAHKREIRRLAAGARASGVTIVPLKMYFKEGRAKLLIGVARGKKHADKRETVKQREAEREIRRAMSRRM